MKLKIKKFVDGNISKYVFYDDQVVFESVLYKYPDYKTRTVICISVQSGCPVGCVFCGTGKQFNRNLTESEIIFQVTHIEKDIGFNFEKSNRLQIMFMSMGEPFMNYENVDYSIIGLNAIYPKSELLISTICPTSINRKFNDFVNKSIKNNKIGLQFSIHESDDVMRNELIPYKNKLSLVEIRNIGVQWWKETGRKVYLNYCIEDNDTEDNFKELITLFPPNCFSFTFSVVSEYNENFKTKPNDNEIQKINNFAMRFSKIGYDTRVFNPDGQDTIGGGCGQLWFVQDYFKKKLREEGKI